MKKILTALIITTAAIWIFPVEAGAEVSVGAQTDMVLVPFQFILIDDPKPKTLTFPGEVEQVIGAGAGRFYSGQGVRARLDLRGSYEDVIGMRARIQVRPEAIGIEDFLQAWWKPADWLRLDAGRFFDDRLRGKINDLDERMSAYNVRMYDGDAIFSRFRTHRSGGQAGLMLTSFIQTNVFGGNEEEISVGALLYDLAPMSVSAAGAVFDGHPDYVNNNADVYHNIQAAVAWTVKDLFQFRAQYLGAKPQVAITRVTDETPLTPFTYNFHIFSITAPRIEAAFAFTGAPGLTIDVGGKVPLPFKEWTRPVSNVFELEDESFITDSVYKSYKNNNIWQAPYQVSVGANFTTGDLGLGGRADLRFGGYTKATVTEMYFPMEVNFHIWPSYDLGFARIIVDFGFEYIGATNDQDGNIVQDGEPLPLNGGNRIGMGISLEKKFPGNCVLKGGVAWKNSGTVNGVQEKMVISIPLFIDWYF
jgi:hypothetical protein